MNNWISGKMKRLSPSVEADFLRQVGLAETLEVVG